MKYTIIVHVSVKPSNVKKFIDFSEILVAKSNLENGCVTYQLLQNTAINNKFMFYEKYENKKAFETHSLTQHYINFTEQVIPLLDNTPLVEVLNA